MLYIICVSVLLELSNLYFQNSKYIFVIPTKILPEASDWEIEFSGIPLENFYVIEVHE